MYAIGSVNWEGISPQILKCLKPTPLGFLLCHLQGMQLAFFSFIFFFFAFYLNKFSDGMNRGAQVVEDILTSGLSAKLMRYLRMRILGEGSSSQKDAVSQSEGKHTSVSSSVRGREENRGRIRSGLDGLKIVDECFSSDQNVEKDREKNSTLRQAHEEEHGVQLLIAELGTSSIDDYVEGDVAGDDEWKNLNLLDGKSKFSERQITRSTHEDADESVRDDAVRRRTNRVWPRSRGKGRIPEGTLENERILLSPSSGLRLSDVARNSKDKNQYKTEDTQRVCDFKKNSIRIGVEPSNLEEDNDDRFTECVVGSSDISEIIKKATRAAEAEARAANAPAEAIKAAGDAAADLVRSTALEVGLVPRLFFNATLPAIDTLNSPCLGMEKH